MFNNELKFEKTLVEVLNKDFGWKNNIPKSCTKDDSIQNDAFSENNDILKNYTEEDLIQNWANIIYELNRDIDRLDKYPLTKSEMKQILDNIEQLRTPLKINGFINGKTVSIKRDNPNDVAHLGKEVSLKIFDRNEIKSGTCRYQIVRQPIFTKKDSIATGGRADVMLLINGMPVIHIELKKSGVPISNACYQIKRYAEKGFFTGIFSLIQIFVAMNPEETVYFANPGPDGSFNEKFYFHWADKFNEGINDWRKIAKEFLSIPMAHQMIGFYTVADNTDGVLKVMRSYQYYAASAISDAVTMHHWDVNNQRGGFIWHTTGSGKTMTSFKSAQLIASSKNADKVIFLMDRVELGIQSLNEYRAFAEDDESVQETEDTQVLITKIKSPNPSDTLIVTSIQKMSNIEEEGKSIKQSDIEILNSKRIVFIVDECHRDTFGKMMCTIKSTFPKALFFGFTGTPIQEHNLKNKSMTSDVFGNELHKYNIADGIKDKNVLGFDLYKVSTFREEDLRKAIAVTKAKAVNEYDAVSDPEKAPIYYRFMNDVPMVGGIDDKGKPYKGIEDYIPRKQYNSDDHRRAVVKNIKESWLNISRNSKFHAIFATSRIPEAYEYYKLIKKEWPKIKVTALFDPSIDNNDGAKVKEDALIDIIKDYNNTYKTSFTLPSYAKMKKDISNRLAHKEAYKNVHLTPDQQIDLLIVVDQMLTGFDSKWVNALYLDKELKHENIIQAFSRTNRVFTEDKPFGTIKYYRKTFTMQNNIDIAVKEYSEDRPSHMFVSSLKEHIESMFTIYKEIEDLFKSEGISDFSRVPKDGPTKFKFVKLFNEFNESLKAAEIQGFKWSDFDEKLEERKYG